MFVGARPYLISAAIIIIAVAATQLIAGQQIQGIADLKTLKPAWPAVGYAFGGAAVALLMLGIGPALSR
jgi:hypothetical protein